MADRQSVSREQLLSFIQKGHQLFEDEQVKKQLKTAHTLGQNVEELITSLQKDVFEKQGIEGDFGISFLSRVSTVFADDPEVLIEFYDFVEREELALDEVEFDKQQYDLKLQMYLQRKRQSYLLKRRCPLSLRSCR
eukprot:TRINITY_DN9081_c0_g1_i1.p1 TRINITY_DN9081_c0_g1~~TRINITY_DN9081_c0_g1_i1.p1  ORF type:complete len:136 (-),score=12.91 TRINITY_DN9081_c0_g1_i1:35-442(-)